MAQSLVFSLVLSEVQYDTVILVLVFQRMDTAIHWINQYPLDKYYQNLLSYPVDSSHRYYITIEIIHYSLDKYYKTHLALDVNLSNA